MSSARVTKVSLYNNGFATFERQAKVKGNSSVDVYFDSEDMGIVLQSFRVWSNDKGHVGNISYEASEEEAEMRLSNSHPLTDTLKHLRGNEVTLETADGNVSGMCVGVEVMLKEMSGEAKPLPCVILLQDAKLVSVPLLSIQRLSMDESSAVSDLQHALSIHRSRQRANMQRLTVFFKGSEEEEATLTMNYNLMLSPWKSSYRITLADEVDEDGRVQLELEGYAVVENEQDEDWRDVSLTVVTGAPPLVKAGAAETGRGGSSGSMSLTVKSVTGSTQTVRLNPDDNVYCLKEKVASAFSCPIGVLRLIFAGKQLEDGRTMTDYNIQSGATVHMVLRASSAESEQSLSSHEVQFALPALDCLSHYPVTLPVTVLRYQTAMVPVVREKMSALAVEVFDMDIRKGNPVMAILFENTTGRSLEGGTLQFVQRGQSVGEAVLPTTHMGDNQTVTYAVDLGCDVSLDTNTSKLPVHRIVIKGGRIERYSRRRTRSMYRIHNRAEKSFSLYISHLFRDGWRLLGEHEVTGVVQQQPVDITDRHYVFVTPVRGKEQKTFSAREETIDCKTSYIETISEEKVDKWVAKGLVDSRTEAELREVFGMRRQVNVLSFEVMQCEGSIREIQDDQRRVRQHLESVSSKEARKYTDKLAKLEDQLEVFQKKIQKMKEEKKKLSSAMTSKVEALEYSFERPPAE